MKYTDAFREGDIIRALTFLSKTVHEIKFSNNQKLRAEISLSQVIALESTHTLTNLLDGISKGHFPMAPAVSERVSPNSTYIVEKKEELEIREPQPIPIPQEPDTVKTKESQKAKPVTKTDDEIIKKIIDELGGNEIQINR